MQWFIGYWAVVLEIHQLTPEDEHHQVKWSLRICWWQEGLSPATTRGRHLLAMQCYFICVNISRTLKKRMVIPWIAKNTLMIHSLRLSYLSGEITSELSKDSPKASFCFLALSSNRSNDLLDEVKCPILGHGLNCRRGAFQTLTEVPTQKRIQLHLHTTLVTFFLILHGNRRYNPM